MARVHSLRLLAIIAIIATSSMLPVTPTRASMAAPAESISPFRQITVVTVNAHMKRGMPSLPERSLALAEALRSRPIASDGNYYAPDVIIVNEIDPVQLTTLRDDLNEVFSAATDSQGEPLSQYEILGYSDTAKAKFLVNVNSTDVSAATYRLWPDDCVNDRFYQVAAGFKEQQSGATFTVAGMHIATDYRDYLLPRDCMLRNAARVRAELAGHPHPVVVGGDFNRRATEVQGKCDPNETNPPLSWWTEMTAPSAVDGRGYVDAVRSWHRTKGLTLVDEWTYEQAVQTRLCNGPVGYRRNRIDYLFVTRDTLVHEAHADSPGWAGPKPGAIGCDSVHPFCKYSDHRFVWGRLGI